MNKSTTIIAIMLLPLMGKTQNIQLLNDPQNDGELLVAYNPPLDSLNASTYTVKYRIKECTEAWGAYDSPSLLRWEEYAEDTITFIPQYGYLQVIAETKIIDDVGSWIVTDTLEWQDENYEPNYYNPLIGSVGLGITADGKKITVSAETNGKIEVTVIYSHNGRKAYLYGTRNSFKVFSGVPKQARIYGNWHKIVKIETTYPDGAKTIRIRGFFN